MSVISVGIADLKVVRQPDSLVTFALGSCVGICLYDPTVKVAGLSHILLPSAAQMPGSATPMKFADTAIPTLIKKLEIFGCKVPNMKAKIAGGAQMFAASNASSIANIGERNVQAVKAALAALRIPILSEDTGKNYGRTLYFDPVEYKMLIKSPKRPDWVG